MKELSKKVFITIFSIFSLFLFVSLLTLNVQNYNREYNGVKRSLSFSDNEKELNNDENFIKNGNMMILDHEIYTITINNNNISKIISHTSLTSGFKVLDIAKGLIGGKPVTTRIGNLYFDKYSYSFKNNGVLVLSNNTSVNNKLRALLLYSVLVFILVEIFILFISQRITIWITKPAKEAFKKQKDFIADASHELKTPLSVIMASSDEIKVSKSNEKYLDNIKHESERMKNLISNMLLLSKIENNGLKNVYSLNNISKIVEKTSLTFEALAFEKNVDINTNIEENIVFNCSSEEIEKLISIVLDNAIKHSYENTTIDINMYNEKCNIIIEVINTGDSIKKGEEEKIFERFYRTNKARSRDENRYGLGLAIAKSITENHNGKIEAFSKDKKTTFKISFKK